MRRQVLARSLARIDLRGARAAFADLAEFAAWLARDATAAERAAFGGIVWAISMIPDSVISVWRFSGTLDDGAVQDMQHRDVDVLMLYPLDLTAVEERFGSWMTQYPYANYVTQAKLLEQGRVAGGAIELAGRRFTTLAATFEPFPSQRLLDMMRNLVEQGGRVVWSGPPPVLTDEGDDALDSWSALFGVSYEPGLNEGLPVPGQQ